MKETAPIPPERSEENIKAIKLRKLATELYESMEVFLFPGLNKESYDRLKSDEEEMPGFATPIDELIEKFHQHGMKIVLGKFVAPGNIMIYPSNSDDQDDNLRLKHLDKTIISDPKLLELLKICDL